MGLTAIVAFSISTMLGVGVFVLPGLVIAETGPTAWLAFLLAGVCVFPAALAKAELATAMPESGGSYVFLERTFGPLVGMISGLGLWASLALKSAFALVGFSAYLSVLVELPDGSAGSIAMQGVSLVLLVAVIGINLVGVRTVSRIQTVVVAAALLFLFVLIAVGAPGIELENFRVPFSKGSEGFVAATAYCFVSYAGVTKIAALAEEVKDPGRNIPRGIIISLVSIAILYSIMTFILSGNVSGEVLAPEGLQPDLHPIYTLAKKVGGAQLATIAAVFGVGTMVAMSNAGLLAASRFPFAMSRDKLLPNLLSSLHPRLLTPIPAILITGAFMGAAILFLDVAKIAKLASAFKIMIFCCVNGAVIFLRESGVHWYKPQFRTPWYPTLPIFGIVSGLVFLSMMGNLAIAAIFAIVIPSVIFFYAYAKPRSSRKGVMGIVRRRQELLAAGAMSREKPQPIALDEAAAVTVLFGNERSPETLVEVGAALAEGQKLEVVHVCEVPEQTLLEAVLEDDLEDRALARRIRSTAAEKDFDLSFDAVVAHDVVQTVHDLTNRLHCNWAVMEWGGRTDHAAMFKSRRSWLLEHVSCNLALYKDAGIRYIRKILVYAEPGPHDALVVTTADHLAEIYGAELDFFVFIPHERSNILEQSQVDYVDQLRQLCSSPTSVVVIHGDNEEKAIEQVTVDHDLLVMGASPAKGLVSLLRGTRKDRLTEHAVCSVLRLKMHRGSLHRVLSRANTEEAREFRGVAGLLSVAQSAARVGLSRKLEVFESFSESFARDSGHPTQEIVEALKRRERTENTSVGMGIAFPHATLEKADKTMLGVYTSKQPIDYESPDGNPVDIFFFTVGPPSDRQEHFRLLARISRMVLETKLLERLRACEDEKGILEAFEESEGELESPFDVGP